MLLSEKQAKKLGVLNNDSGKSPKHKRGKRNETKRQDEAKETDEGCFLLRVKAYRQRLLDYDNIYAKHWIDCLPKIGIIPDDSPKYIKKYEVEQFKVKTEKEERTVLEVWDLPKE